MAHPAACPHDPIEEVFPDVFFVRGSVRMNALMSITRNMVIIRHDGQLTLVDPMRLSEAEEKRLEGLGNIRHILRLGPMHGQDDPYYIERFGAQLWAPGTSEAYPEPKADVVFTEETQLPFPDAELFCFEGLVQKEAALLLRREGGVLVTCDGIQHYGDFRHNNLLARMMMPLIGFSKTTLLGPIWLKTMTPEGGNLESEFRRLLGLEFDHLMSAHGSLLRGGAHAAVEAAVDKAFAK